MTAGDVSVERNTLLTGAMDHKIADETEANAIIKRVEYFKQTGKTLTEKDENDYLPLSNDFQPNELLWLGQIGSNIFCEWG